MSFFVIIPGGEHMEMFFDMQADPGEMRNMAGENALTGQRDRHRQLLAQWKQTTEEARYYPLITRQYSPSNKKKQ
jgi:hypothetical protein